MSEITEQRERDVLDAAARGLTVTETGRELFLSPDTVRDYRKRILHRMGARNMTQAVAMQRPPTP